MYLLYAGGANTEMPSEASKSQMNRMGGSAMAWLGALRKPLVGLEPPSRCTWEMHSLGLRGLPSGVSKAISQKESRQSHVTI